MSLVWRRPSTITACLTAVLVIAATAAIVRLLRQDTDFGIYLQAARELRQGGLDLYRPHTTHGPFAYPHWFALALAGVDSLLPERGLRVLFGLSQGIATAWIAVDLHRVAGRVVVLRPWHWALLAVLLGRAVSTNWTNGQLSLWTGALTLRGIRHLGEGRHGHAGVELGVAAALKLTAGLFLPVLPLLGAWPAAIAMAATLGGLLLLLPWPLLGTAEHLRHLHDFARAMLHPLADPRAGAVDIWHGSSASVQGTLRDLLQARPMPGETHPLHLLDLTDGALHGAVILWSSALLALLAIGWWRVRGELAGRRLPLQASLVCLAIALLSPLTRTYHLTGVVLPGLLLAAAGPGRGPRRAIWIGTCVALVLAMPLRQKALLGAELWSRLDHLGLLHLGLVGMALWLASWPAGSESYPTAAASPSRSTSVPPSSTSSDFASR